MPKIKMDGLDALRGTMRYPSRIEKFILPKNLQTKTSLKPCPIYAGVSCSSSFLHPLFATTKYHILNSITCFADLCRARGIYKGFCGPDQRERMDLDYFLMHQLNNKLINQPVLIDSLIIANISNHNPQDFFPGDWYGTKECYVLTPRSCYLYGLVFRPDRRAGNGYWKGTTPGNVISGMDGLVGVKKNLCFYEGDQSQSHGLQTNWKMIEYRLQQHICSFTCDHKSGRLDNWVLCKIYEDLGPEALFSQMERMNI